MAMAPTAAKRTAKRPVASSFPAAPEEVEAAVEAVEEALVAEAVPDMDMDMELAMEEAPAAAELRLGRGREGLVRFYREIMLGRTYLTAELAEAATEEAAEEAELTALAAAAVVEEMRAEAELLAATGAAAAPLPIQEVLDPG
jgi:hypothetical protein